MTLEPVEAAGSRPVEGSLLSIGELARASGLPVSALRFYDGAGVLRPVAVDERTGYRRYGHSQVASARLVARLRRVGMPLPDVRRLLGPGLPAAEAHRLLDAHLARLEGGLADARRELSAVRSLLDPTETPMELTRDARALAAGIDAVRYAVGADPDRPVLATVLLERDGDVLWLVATDRYRLATATVPVGAGGALRVLLPVALVDAARPLLTAGQVRLAVTGDAVELTAGDRSVRGTAAAEEFPDWRRLEPAASAHRVPLSGPEFRAALAAGPAVRQTREADGVEYDTVVLVVGPDGELTVGGDGDGLRVGVNRDFLVEALGGHDQLVLELDGPTRPLAVRVPGGPHWSLLMPVALDRATATR